MYNYTPVFLRGRIFIGTATYRAVLYHDSINQGTNIVKPREVLVSHLHLSRHSPCTSSLAQQGEATVVVVVVVVVLNQATVGIWRQITHLALYCLYIIKRVYLEHRYQRLNAVRK